MGLQCGSGNSPPLISTLWNIGILLHKQATRAKHFDGKCTILWFNDFKNLKFQKYVVKLFANLDATL
jgi:hypothetical protein